MEQRDYFVLWREDWDDQEGWFTKAEAKELIDRIWQLEADGESGEPMILSVIQGRNALDDFA
jgi:hypothetical protein